VRQRLLIEIEYEDGHHIGGMLDDACKAIFNLQDALKPGLSHRVPLVWTGKPYGSVRFAQTPAEAAIHRQRGTAYSVLEEATAQCAVPIPDDATVQVYRDRKTGDLFIRPLDEFRDGRFAPAEAANV